MTVTLVDEQDDPLPTGLDELARLVIAREGFPGEAEVAVHFIDPERMTGLNGRYLGKHGPTDVLALPIEDLQAGEVPAVPDGPPLQLGDIFVCPGVVRAQAANAGVPFENEMSLMVVHGLLHLMGYDHQTNSDAELMERRETELLAEVGLVRR